MDSIRWLLKKIRRDIHATKNSIFRGEDIYYADRLLADAEAQGLIFQRPDDSYELTDIGEDFLD